MYQYIPCLALQIRNPTQIIFEGLETLRIDLCQISSLEIIVETKQTNI